MSSVPDHIKTRAAELRQEINDYRYNYHVLDRSTMSEAAADALKHELAQLETQYPELITADSPSQKVAGAPLDRFTKVAHSVPMISLADVFDQAELRAWYDKAVVAGAKEFFCDIKMDGLACALIYQNGQLVQAITRGDGRIGEDVTANVKMIKNIPQQLATTARRLEVRGEIVIYKADFAQLNLARQQANEALYANPRNLAAGTIRQLDSAVVAARPLHFVAYDLVEPAAATFALAYQQLRQLGFQTSGQEQTLSDFAAIYQRLTALEQTRRELQFNTDGAVIKVNDKAIFTAMGVAGKAPRGATAFKFAAEENVSVVQDIILSIGRTGVVTPVAFFRPVNIAGSMVQHASLYNADEIAKQDIRIGDTVIVYKAGDIIPKVKSVIKRLRPTNSQPFDFAAELKREFPNEEFRRDGIAWRLANNSTTMLVRSIVYFASRETMNILELGPRAAASLVEAGLVKNLPDLYRLRAEQVAELEHYAQVSAEKLVASIQKSKSAPLDKFLAAIGIPQVGIRTAHDLVAHFGSLEKIEQATLEELLAIDGIGEKVAESILLWFSEAENSAMLDDFRQLGLQLAAPQVGTKLAGLTFVLTGTFTRAREMIADQIVAAGGKVSGSVSAHTSYLVAGTGGGSKREKAAKLGVPIISEEELQARLQE